MIHCDWYIRYDLLYSHSHDRYTYWGFDALYVKTKENLTNKVYLENILSYRYVILLICKEWMISLNSVLSFRSNCSEVLLGKGVLKICSKFTGEYPCRSVISIKLQSSFIEITPRQRCSPVNLLHIFRTPFLKNTSGRLVLTFGKVQTEAATRGVL